MSATIKYKGNTIASITTDSSKTLKTSGKYCDGDIVVENVQDGGITPSGNKAITPSETAQSGIDVTNFKTVSVGAISSTYVGSGVTKKAAATVAPSTSEQTVCASGVYTTGEQKVSAITPSIVGNLDASSFAASIVAAVEGKGVTVPSGTLLDGMAALIEAIEAGSGGVEVNIGSFILSSSIKIYGTEGYSIIHGLSSSPDLFVLLKNDELNRAGVLSLYIYYKNKSGGKAVYGGTGSSGYMSIHHIAPTITNETVTIISDYERINELTDNIEYIWIAMGGLP